MVARRARSPRASSTRNAFAQALAIALNGLDKFQLNVKIQTPFGTHRIKA